VEGEGKLGKEEPGGPNPFHDDTPHDAYFTGSLRATFSYTDVTASDCKACPEPRRRERSTPGLSGLRSLPRAQPKGSLRALTITMVIHLNNTSRKKFFEPQRSRNSLPHSPPKTSPCSPTWKPPRQSDRHGEPPA
jgi:hypothetical protein